MKKLLEIDIIKAALCILLAPAIFVFLVMVVFKTWVVENLLFGSVEMAIILSLILSLLPLLVITWHSVKGIRALMHKLEN